MILFIAHCIHKNTRFFSESNSSELLLQSSFLFTNTRRYRKLSTIILLGKYSYVLIFNFTILDIFIRIFVFFYTHTIRRSASTVVSLENQKVLLGFIHENTQCVQLLSEANFLNFYYNLRFFLQIRKLSRRLHRTWNYNQKIKTKFHP